VHAVVARSTFPSQNALNNVRSTFGSCEMSKKCTSLWREAHLQVKKLKAPHVWSTIRSSVMSKKCTPLRREAHCEVKMLKATCSDHFWTSQFHAVSRGTCAVVALPLASSRILISMRCPEPLSVAHADPKEPFIFGPLRRIPQELCTDCCH